jgi:hypothetical protein
MARPGHLVVRIEPIADLDDGRLCREGVSELVVDCVLDKGTASGRRTPDGSRREWPSAVAPTLAKQTASSVPPSTLS